MQQLTCPKCRSTELLIRQAKGFERLRIFLTGLRTFKCPDCYHDFRAPDRRQAPRMNEQEAMFAGALVSHKSKHV
jgi:transposase-like protein